MIDRRTMRTPATILVALTTFAVIANMCHGLAAPKPTQTAASSRRSFLWNTACTMTGAVLISTTANAIDTPNAIDVDSFSRTGMVAQPVGVSGQAGKSKPETGVVLREGSDVRRDSKTGDVLAEILVQTASKEYMPVVASFSSPWPLGR